MCKRKNAFSLMEAMIVVAIVGVLSAVAVPFYQSYKIKSVIGSAMPTINAFVQQVVETQEAATQPFLSIEFQGNTYGFAQSGATTSLDVPPIINADFYGSAYAGNGPNESVSCFSLTGLEGIPGYVAPTSVSIGQFARVCVKVSYEDNMYVRRCGQHDLGNPANYEIPLEYLPNSCQCTELRTNTCPT